MLSAKHNDRNQEELAYDSTHSKVSEQKDFKEILKKIKLEKSIVRKKILAEQKKKFELEKEVRLSFDL